MDWNELIRDWVEGPCTSCGSGSSPDASQHVAMPVTRPSYVDPYLEGLTGPDEQHRADPHAHCINPKCTQQFDDSMIDPDGTITCPSCGFNQNVLNEDERAWMPGVQGLNPGGVTRSGLTLDQMGAIAEQIVDRMGELPGVGAVIESFSNLKQNPIDVIVQGQQGKFGCEIKANHSQAQERFKVGGKEERHAKIVYCLTHGLKPALIGVRLNFYTDKAYIFFREGLSDTWIGNSKMLHVATLDFGDLNPFKSPDPQAQALAVDNAHLPDQADDSDIDAAFGPAQKVANDDFEHEHPRDEKGEFVVKKDEHSVKVHDHKGKHTHNAIRCKHCGATNYVPHGHKGRLECSTCGEDPERKLTLAKVVLGNPGLADQVAQELGWNFAGRNSNGHRIYDFNDPNGTYHTVMVGSGAHGKNGGVIDAQRLRQRATKCMNGQCMHGPKDAAIPPMDEPGAPVLRAGQVINGKIVLEIDGGIALVQDLQTGAEDVVPTSELRAARADDDR